MWYLAGIRRLCDIAGCCDDRLRYAEAVTCFAGWILVSNIWKHGCRHLHLCGSDAVLSTEEAVIHPEGSNIPGAKLQGNIASHGLSYQHAGTPAL